MGNESKAIDFYCKRCRKSYKVAYTLTGDDDALALTNVCMKCHTCKRVAVLKKYTEGLIKTYADRGKCFI